MNPRWMSTASMLVALLFEVGCMSMDSLNTRSPSIVFKSDATIAELEECLIQGFGMIGSPVVYRKPDRTIINYDGYSAILSFILYRQDGHSIVEERYPHGQMGGKIRKRIDYCIALPRSAEGAG